MANPEHVEILKQGVNVWNEWREENREIRPDLREADLSEDAGSSVHDAFDPSSIIIQHSIFDIHRGITSHGWELPRSLRGGVLLVN